MKSLASTAAAGQPEIPDYELLKNIGGGAYGEVWLAQSVATGALRAVKIIRGSTFPDDRPFNREFDGIKKFEEVSRSHPSQLALFHVGRNDTAQYFYHVMELADGVGEGDGISVLGSGRTSSPDTKSETRDARPQTLNVAAP